MPLSRPGSGAMKLLFVVALLATGTVCAEPIPIAEVKRDEPVMFERDVLPILDRNCLACHSAAMITAQPRLSRVQWGETIAKMRTVYAAPIDPADDKAILDWLVAD